jgi:LCP family protein required for cell wall assembly
MAAQFSAYSSDGSHRPRRRAWGWWLLGLSIMTMIGWFATGPLLALRSIQEGQSDQLGLFGFVGKIVSSAQLKGEAEGRINVLLLGIGGKGHPGGTLSDTIQVVSINPKEKQVAILSLPRDMRVSIPGAGVNKLNYAHAYGELNPKTGGGPQVARQVVSTVLDIPIHYYVRMDFTGFEKLVDALGGVDVFVDKAINDPFYPAPDMIRYDPFRISAGQHHMDGDTALKYVRSRETTSDFDRSRRQMQMLQAIRDRAISLDILVNPRKVNELAGILGDHVRTDMATWEIARMVDVAAREGSSYAVATRVLSSGAGEPLVAVNEGGYFLVPRTGNFKEIQDIANNIFINAFVSEEKARIELVNASGNTQRFSQLVSLLRTQGYVIAATRTAPVAETTIVDYSSGAKPNTLKLLAKQFNVTAQSEARPSGSSVDIQVVVGADYQGDA